MPFETGNTLGKQQRAVKGILHKLCVQEDWQRVHRMLHSILDKASEGDMAAATFITERLDGKVESIEDSYAPQERFSCIRMVLYVPPALMPSNEVIETVEVVPEVGLDGVESDV